MNLSIVKHYPFQQYQLLKTQKNLKILLVPNALMAIHTPSSINFVLRKVVKNLTMKLATAREHNAGKGFNFLKGDADQSRIMVVALKENTHDLRVHFSVTPLRQEIVFWPIPGTQNNVINAKKATFLMRRKEPASAFKSAKKGTTI